MTGSLKSRNALAQIHLHSKCLCPLRSPCRAKYLHPEHRFRLTLGYLPFQPVNLPTKIQNA
jgi:hypothetical protein